MTATTWTERYLAAVLRSIPDKQRKDVERELGSSIADAVEERVAAGEDRTAAERSVLEGMGDPSTLASGYTGRPNYLLGPELYAIWRHFLPRIIAVVVPIAALVTGGVQIAAGNSYADAMAAAIGGAITTMVHLAFWTTLTFIVLERADEARDAKSELVSKVGPWTLERLPDPSPSRVSASEAVGEVITALITIGGLLFLQNLGSVVAPGSNIPLFAPEVTGFWLPILIAILGALALLQLVVFAVRRWTMPLVGVYAILEIAFAAPVIWLALNGTLINPAFAAEVGFPSLAEGDGWVMLAVAVFTTLVTAWEVISTYIRARGGPRLSTWLDLRRAA